MPAFAPEAAEGEAGLDVVLFQAGGMRWGLEASKVAALHSSDGPGSAQAIEFLLGLPPPDQAAPRHLLQVRRAAGELWLNLGGPVELRRLPAATIHPLPPLLAARLALPALRALHLDGGALVLLLDGERLHGDTLPATAG